MIQDQLDGKPKHMIHGKQNTCEIYGAMIYNGSIYNMAWVIILYNRINGNMQCKHEKNVKYTVCMALFTA